MTNPFPFGLWSVWWWSTKQLHVRDWLKLGRIKLWWSLHTLYSLIALFSLFSPISLTHCSLSLCSLFLSLSLCSFDLSVPSITCKIVSWRDHERTKNTSRRCGVLLCEWVSDECVCVPQVTKSGGTKWWHLSQMSRRSPHPFGDLVT